MTPMLAALDWGTFITSVATGTAAAGVVTWYLRQRELRETWRRDRLREDLSRYMPMVAELLQLSEDVHTAFSDAKTTTAGEQSLTAQQKADIFGNELISLASQGPTSEAILALAQHVVGIPNRTVYVDADTSAAMYAIASLERRLASVRAGAASTAGPQQFARGSEMGPGGGPAGAAVPIIAHAGEYVATPQQLADLQRQPSLPNPGGGTPASTGFDYARLAAAITAHPPWAYVVAPDVARGMHTSRRR